MKIIDPKLKFRGNLAMDNNPENIVVHHALKRNCTIQDVHSWHLANGWAGCGYHFFINKKGEVFRGRPDEAVGAHCPQESMNRRSYGICLEGCYEEYLDQTDRSVPPEQLDALVELVKFLGVPSEKVFKHADFAQKLCPGNFFPWKEFKERLSAVPPEESLEKRVERLEKLFAQIKELL